MTRDVAFEKGKRKADSRAPKRLPERWYKAYPARYLKRTEHLTFELRSAYRLLIDVFYEHDGPLPNDDARIARRLGCGVLKWRPIRDRLIAEKLIYIGADGMLHQSTVDEVIAERKTKGAKVRVANARRPRVCPKIPGDMSGDIPLDMSGDIPGDLPGNVSDINGSSRNACREHGPYARSSTDRYSLYKGYREEDGSCVRGDEVGVDDHAPFGIPSDDTRIVQLFPEPASIALDVEAA